MKSEGLFRTNVDLKAKYFTNDTAFKVVLNNEQPGLFYFNNKPIVIGINDSVYFTFDLFTNKYMLSGGKYNRNYELINEISEVGKGSIPHFNSNINTYKDSTEEIRNLQLRFVDSVERLGSLSNDVHYYVRDFINFSYLLKVLGPLNKNNAAVYWPRIFSNKMETEIWAKLKNNTRSSNQPQYLFAVFSFLQSKLYSKSIGNMEYHFFDILLNDNFAIKNKRNLLFFSFSNSGLSKSLSQQELIEIYNRIIKLGYSINQLEKLSERFQELSHNGSTIPDSILYNTRVLDTNLERHTLDEVLKKSRGRILIDFWASWCKPCIAELPRVKKLKGVTVIYISLDDHKSKWKESYIKYNIDNNQFLMEGNFSSKLVKFLRFKSIPKFLFIDEFGETFSLDYFEEVEKYLIRP